MPYFIFMLILTIRVYDFDIAITHSDHCSQNWAEMGGCFT